MLPHSIIEAYKSNLMSNIYYVIKLDTNTLLGSTSIQIYHNPDYIREIDVQDNDVDAAPEGCIPGPGPRGLGTKRKLFNSGNQCSGDQNREIDAREIDIVSIVR